MSKRFFLSALCATLFTPLVMQSASAQVSSDSLRCDEQTLRRIYEEVEDAQKSKNAIEDRSEEKFESLIERGRTAAADVTEEIERAESELELAVRECSATGASECAKARRLSDLIVTLKAALAELFRDVSAALEALETRTEAAIEPLEAFINRGTNYIRECKK